MSVEIENTAVIVAPLDTYTAEKVNFIDSIEQSVKNSIDEIYVDCQKLVSITSSHVSLLWEAMQLCKEHNILFTLRNVSVGIHKVFKVLDLDEFFNIEQDSSKPIEHSKTGEIALFIISPYESVFRPNIENIIREKLKLDHHLKKTPISHKIIYEIETIFYEVTTNIRRHAQITANDPIKFSLNQMNDSVILHFEDRGVLFDLRKHEVNYKPDQAIKDRMKNGLGILMIKKMADSILYERRDSKNILTVTKAWSKCDGK